MAMKKDTRRSSANSELTQRGLRLSRDVIRTLTAGDLAHAVGGSCETGSLTTDKTKNTSLK
jgi:hypothetical protein